MDFEVKNIGGSEVFWVEENVLSYVFFRSDTDLITCHRYMSGNGDNG